VSPDASASVGCAPSGHAACYTAGMTESSGRPRLIPKTTIIAAGVVVVLIVSAIGGSYLVARSRLVPAPDVRGLPLVVAESHLLEAGLRSQQVSTQVSPSVPVGGVISQSPDPDTLLEAGSFVKLVVSAGPQTYIVPDLVGSPAHGAIDVLTALGFVVVTVEVSSDTTTVVVLEMFPAPGASVGVGDEIRLTVPGNPGTSAAVLPYDLEGVTVLLDPQPPLGSQAGDAPLEVARRLQALLQAAGATVASTRDPGTSPSPADREAAARSFSASLLVGIDVRSNGVAGVTVQHTPGASRFAAASLEHARAITRAASVPGLTVNEPVGVDDPVLTAFPGPGVRVVVGDISVESDRIRFADPAWADQVARAIYRGVGTTLAPD